MVNAEADRSRFSALLKRFPDRRVLVLGDLMLDHFIRGRTSRISPEAPVPVVAVAEETHMPGGAGNVCSNLCALGVGVSVFSILGDDPAGRTLLVDLEERGIDTTGVLQESARVTTQKCRVVAEHQQVVRFDRETASDISPAAQAEIGRRLEIAIKKADALVISDYGKGIVSAEAVRRALRAAHRAKLPVLVDPKIENFRRYRGVDCMTPNIHEAWAGMGLPPNPSLDAVVNLGRKILKTLRLRSVLVTRGEHGMSLFEKNSVRHIPTVAREVFDVTGAGDTVISVMAAGLASGARLHEAAVLANLAAGIVVGKLGTATVSLSELADAAGRHRS